MQSILGKIPDWKGFDEDMVDCLLRLSSPTSNRSKKATLYIVGDGTRIPAKLVNNTRLADRTDSLRAVTEAQARDEDVSPSLLNTAIGGYGPIALQRMRDKCHELGIAFIVAPFEAEAQLVRMQRDRVIDAILCNDSDYAVLGGKHILFDKKGSLWSGEILYWRGREVLDFPTDSQLISMAIDGQPHYAKLALLVKQFGSQLLDIFCPLLHNDYCVLTGVGPPTAIAIAENALGGVPLKQLQSKCGLENVVEYLRKPVPRREVFFNAYIMFNNIAKEVVHVTQPKIKPGAAAQTATSIVLAQLQKAVIMFHFAGVAVLCLDKPPEVCFMTPLDPDIALLYFSDTWTVEQIIEFVALRTHSTIGISKFLGGFFDLKTLEPLTAFYAAMNPPTILCNIRGIVATPRLFPIESLDIPTNAELKEMAVAKLHAFLKSWGIPSSDKNKAELLKLAENAADMQRKSGIQYFSSSVSSPEEAIKHTKMITDCYTNINEAGWISAVDLLVAPNNITWNLSDSVLEIFLATHPSSTRKGDIQNSRAECQSLSLQTGSCCAHWYPIESVTIVVVRVHAYSTQQWQ